MTQLKQQINLNDLPDLDNNFELIPEGWYTAVISKAEVKDTKSGSGKYINIQFDITGPSYHGRVVFCRINFMNASNAAQRIGQAQLKKLMLSLGLTSIDDTDQFINGVEIKIKVALIPEQNGYSASNDVKDFKSNSSMSDFKKTKNNNEKQSTQEKSTPPWAK